jgi:SAM-dependent methyltransferase
MATSRIRETLVEIGAIDTESVAAFAPRARDRDVTVFRDESSGVIFIDDFYVGDDEYESGEYRGEDEPSFEDRMDSDRRIVAFRPVYEGRRVLDFGCGAGSFLRGAQPVAAAVYGSELQRSYRDRLTADGILCFADVADAPADLDACFMFHVLEHLPDPLPVLETIRGKLAPDGVIVVEVPHARDFLMNELGSAEFTAFTLWSQHLVLHTRESLTALLQAAGYVDVQVTGIQRYGLANHLTWLSAGTPGGHRGPLARIETPELADAYEESLARIDATDTLVATAHRPQ